jgi:hypothetical protein
MFWAWKDTILSHYSVLSGKGLKNEKRTKLLAISALSTLSFFLAPCNLAEGPPTRNFGPLSEKKLRSFVLKS